jgi:hypothetical protein
MVGVVWIYVSQERGFLTCGNEYDTENSVSKQGEQYLE